MASIDQISNTESGSSIRSKLNATITEANKVDDKIGSLSDDTNPQLSASLKTNSHSIQESKGVDIESATDINILGDGNYFVVTGENNINAIISDAWVSGAVIRLKFEDVLTIVHNASVSGSNKAIFLQSQDNYTTVAEDILELQYDGVLWREVNNLTTAISANQQSITSATTVTPTGDSKENEQYITALASNLTINAPSGTAANGNNLMVRITSDATPRALTWNAIYSNFLGTLPSTTVASKTMYINFIYNSTAVKWEHVSTVQGV